MAENSGGGRQGVEGGVESPLGIDTPGVEELPQGDDTSGVTPEGDRVPGEDGRVQGEDRNPPPPPPEKPSRAEIAAKTRG